MPSATIPDGLLLEPHQLFSALKVALKLSITLPVPRILLKLIVAVPVLKIAPP